MSEKLKREFIELLEKDTEFRYTVAGYLGLSEILKRLDRLEEGQNRLWEEVRALREGQNRLWEGQNRLLENQNRLWEEVRRMRKYMVSGFRDLEASIGVAFEDHAASFLEVMLEEIGYPEAGVAKKTLVHDGEIVEINLFCEKPLVVGEATVSVRSAGEAEGEVQKLLKHAKVVEERYGKPEMIILSVARPTEEAAKTLKALAEKHGIRLILGKEMEEALAI
jgi:nucleotide-binding universal stress UspA family protein